jgi:hypothetical protein
MSMIERLEDRIAPAILVNATTVTYQDLDGDLVTIKVSKPIFTDANVAGICNFSDFDASGPQQLFALVLAGLPASANGLDITITAKRSPTAGGNGAIADLGINASDIDNNVGSGVGIDLGKVSIKGDLTYIDVGDEDETTPALKSLTVNSVGATAPNIESEINGTVGSIKVRGNMSGTLDVNGGDFSVPGIKNILIGGSVLPSAGGGGGIINAFIGFGKVVIKGDVIGGNDPGSGAIFSANSMQTLVVHGSIVGGDGDGSGRVTASGFTNLTIRGSIIGNDGEESGSVRGYATGIKKGVIGGSLIGGAGDFSGQIEAGGNTGSPGSIGNLLIKGSIQGQVLASGDNALGAGVYSNGFIKSLTILGDVSRANIIAGIAPGADAQFGNAGDADSAAGGANTISSIAKLVIKGSVLGTAPVGDSFGIEANEILFVKIGPAVFKSTDPALNFNTGIQLTPSQDVLLRVIPEA